MQRNTATPVIAEKLDSEAKDETFQNLLSSQRQLLSQINTGTAPPDAFAPERSPRTGKRSATMGGELLSHSRMNRSITAPPANDFVYSKMSPIGTDRLMDPPSTTDPAFPLPPLVVKGDCDLDVDCDAKISKQLPNLALSLSFLEIEEPRRGSLGSNKEQEIGMYDPDGRLNVDDEDKEEEDDDEDDDEDEMSSIEPLDYKYDEQPPFLLVNELAALDTAMARSQESQQMIHDWDRKMGLKRSHSKTMRLSSRTRKKIRAQLKKEITSINNKQASSEGE